MKQPQLLLKFIRILGVLWYGKNCPQEWTLIVCLTAFVNRDLYRRSFLSGMNLL